jgi:8-oxo-dGTP pyrophosphatase MutT (NUDIX family)/mannose-6-phosphate isomerase-like protein (cupin superfamily)
MSESEPVAKRARPGAYLAGAECNICLEATTATCDASSACLVVDCFHVFCLTCIAMWASIQPSCPLCKCKFAEVIFDIRSDADSRRLSLDALLRDYAGAGAPAPPPPSRLSVYERGLRAVEPPEAWRAPPQSTSSDKPFCLAKPSEQTRLRPWVRREVCQLLGIAHVDIVTSVVLALVARCNLTTDADAAVVVAQVRPYFHVRASHFVHELSVFAASGLSVRLFDAAVQYGESDDAVVDTAPADNSATDDDVIEIITIDDDDGDDDVRDDDCVHYTLDVLISLRGTANAHLMAVSTTSSTLAPSLRVKLALWVLPPKLVRGGVGGAGDDDAGGSVMPADAMLDLAFVVDQVTFIVAHYPCDSVAAVAALVCRYFTSPSNVAAARAADIQTYITRADVELNLVSTLSRGVFQSRRSPHLRRRVINAGDVSVGVDHHSYVYAHDTSDCAMETNAWGHVDVIQELDAAGIVRLVVAPHKAIPLHIHRRMRESELLLTSGGVVVAANAAHSLRARRGTSFYWPLLHPHGYTNASAAPLCVLCVDVPKFIPSDEIIVAAADYAADAGAVLSSEAYARTTHAGRLLTHPYFAPLVVDLLVEPAILPSPSSSSTATTRKTAFACPDCDVFVFPAADPIGSDAKPSTCSLSLCRHARYHGDDAAASTVLASSSSLSPHVRVSFPRPHAVLVLAFWLPPAPAPPLLMLVHHRRRGWELPGGKVEPGETAAAAAARETREEGAVDVDAASLCCVGQYVIRGDGDGDVHIKSVFVAVIRSVLRADATAAAAADGGDAALKHETNRRMFVACDDVPLASDGGGADEAETARVEGVRVRSNRLLHTEAAWRDATVSPLLCDNVFPLVAKVAVGIAQSKQYRNN